MVFPQRQAQSLINQFNNIIINQQVNMSYPVVDYVLSPFDGNLNPGDPQDIKIYLQTTKGIFFFKSGHLAQIACSL